MVLLAVALRRQIGFTEESWFIIRVVLVLATGAVAAFIPGFLNVTVSNYVRAGGALAVFLLIYAFNPPPLRRRRRH